MCAPGDGDPRGCAPRCSAPRDPETPAELAVVRTLCLGGGQRTRELIADRREDGAPVGLELAAPMVRLAATLRPARARRPDRCRRPGSATLGIAADDVRRVLIERLLLGAEGVGDHGRSGRGQVERRIARVRRRHQREPEVHAPEQLLIVVPAEVLDERRADASRERNRLQVPADEEEVPLRGIEVAAFDGAGDRLETAVVEVAQVLRSRVEDEVAFARRRLLRAVSGTPGTPARTTTARAACASSPPKR